ncbi:AI-2E family transporter [Bacillus songklensis]|uniref:AI-2E family transporter n=1 Tax=Bacillus songklensis TaxID=1069116 RepID=A0ABV8B0V3_9BACI
MSKSKVQFWTLQILLIVLIIYVSTKISFLFEPIVVFVSTLFFPVLISGFLYFLFSPIVNFLIKYKIPRNLAILILYIVFIGLMSVGIGVVAPILSDQITDLVRNMPSYISKIRIFFDDLSQSKWFKWMLGQEFVSLEKMEETLTNYAASLPDNLTRSVRTVFGVIANITLTVVTVPFILFYMFKDGHKFPKAAVRFLPSSYRRDGLHIIEETGETLSAYIQGQFLVALFVGIFTFIGYLIIGLPYGLTLAIVVAITNIIPYLGPFIGAAPAVVIGLLDSPTKALLVIVVITIVQQIDGNFISPLVIGKRLDIHPLTIIIILLVAGNLAGVLGMILGVPLYAVTKTIIINIVKLVRLRNRETKEDVPI